MLIRSLERGPDVYSVILATQFHSVHRSYCSGMAEMTKRRLLYVIGIPSAIIRKRAASLASLAGQNP
jgi:hypothetical protein